MNDEEIITIYLMLLKSNIEVYVHGTIEASNKSNKDNLKYGLDQSLSSQERTYNEMVNNSWYKVENIDCNCIKKTFDKLSKNF